MSRSVSHSVNTNGENSPETTRETASKSKSEQSSSIEDEGESDGGVTALSHDSIFFILSNSRRRGVIYCLKRAEGPLDVGQLSTLVAAMENDVTTEEITYSQRKRVYTSLHQSHLPKMDEVGIVSFDRRAGTVTPAEKLEEIDVYLEVVPDPELSWSEFYFGIGVLSLVTALLGWAGVYPFGLVPETVYVAVFAVVLTTASVIQWHHTKTPFHEDELDTDVADDL